MQAAVNTQRERAIKPNMGNKDLCALPEEAKKALIVKALSAQGYRPTDAAALLNMQRSHVAKVSKMSDTGLLAPLAKIYKKNIKSLAQGKLVGDMSEIKGSDVLGALKEIGLRVDAPVSKQEIKSTHLNIDITSEDMARIDALMGRRMSDISTPQHVVIEHGETAVLCHDTNDIK